MFIWSVLMGEWLGRACEQLNLFHKPHLEAWLAVIKHLITSGVWRAGPPAVKDRKDAVNASSGRPILLRGCSLGSCLPHPRISSAANVHSRSCG